MNCHSFSLFKCLRGVLHSVTPLCYVLAKQFPGCVFRCPVPHGSPWRLCDISFRETPFLFFSRFHEKSKTLKPQDIHWSPEDPAKFRKSNLRPGVHGHLGVLQCATVQKRPGAVVKPWGTTDLGCARCLLERSWEMAMVYHGILLLGYNGVCGVYIISINLSYPTLSYPTLPYPILSYTIHLSVEFWWNYATQTTIAWFWAILRLELTGATGVRTAQELPGLFVHTPASQVAWWGDEKG